MLCWSMIMASFLFPTLTTVMILILYLLAFTGTVRGYLWDEFTFKATVECYDESSPSVVGKTRTVELYSSKHQRGIVKLCLSDNYLDRPDANDNLMEYHYDGNHNIWLEVMPRRNICILGSQYNLQLRLYKSPIYPIVDEIVNSICSECLKDPSSRYLIGTARFLALVQKLRPQFGEVSTSTSSHLSIYHLDNLKVDDVSWLELFVHYDKVLDDTSDQVPPRFIRLHHHKRDSAETHVIDISFYQFEPIRDLSAVQAQVEQVQSMFAFPHGMSCSRALSLALGHRKQSQVEIIQRELKDVDKFSFTARDLVSPSNVMETFYALDLRAKLIRKDQYHVDSGFRSTTIYNLDDRFAYNILTSKRQSVQVKCIMRELNGSKSSKDLDEKFKFIDFERLVYLGSAKLNSVDALIFEEFSSSPHPWIQSPVWAKHHREADRRIRADLTGSAQVYTVYYFAVGSLSGRATGQSIGPLMRVEINMRDSLQRLVWQRSLVITEFVSAGLANFRAKLDGTNMFSVANLCGFESESGQISAILESELDNTNFIKLDPDKRNDVLIKSLSDNYSIHLTQINRFSSRLLARNKPDRLIVELDLSMSSRLEQSISSIDCVYLGKGQLREENSQEQFTDMATSFEDCIWLAHQFSMLHHDGHEVVFTYDDRSRCLVDRSYRLGSLQEREPEDLNIKALDDDRGKMRIFAIKRTDESKPMGTKGMHFFQVGSLKSIGLILSLRLDGSDQRELRLRFTRVSLSGHLAKVYGQNYHPRRISGLSWSETDEHGDALHRQVAPDGGWQTSGLIVLDAQMTEALCQSHCLLDLNCNSYSFCERTYGSEPKCLVSSVDLSKSSVMKYLENLSDDRLDKRYRPRRVTMLFDGASRQQTKVEVILDRSCSISAKSHSDLFRQTYKVKLGQSSMNSIDRSVQDKDECAKRCFDKNIIYIASLIGHKLAIQERLTESKTLDQLQSVWEPMSVWLRQDLGDFCTGFLYSNEMPMASGSGSGSGTNGCLLETATAPSGAPNHQGNPLIKEDETKDRAPVAMIHHKLVYLHLFRRLPGLRLLDGGEQKKSIGVDKNNSLALMPNSQVKLPMDDAEYCARACVLQLHGPRPMCSSFDFVHEQNGNKVLRYCLLNSKSLHDISQSSSISEQQIVHENLNTLRLWHFEPRETALRVAHLEHKRNSPDRNRKVPRAFMSILFMLVTVGLISGLAIGITLTRRLLEMAQRADEQPASGRTARIIHRLSGVSLRSNLREIEVNY